MSEPPETGGGETVESEPDGVDAEDLEAVDEGLEELFDRAEDILSRLSEEAEDADTEELHEDLAALAEIFDQIEDIVGAIDLEDLPEILDLDELSSVVNAEELPEAIAERDFGEALNPEHIPRLIHLHELWGSVDVFEILESKDDLSEATDELDDGADGDEDGLMDGMSDTVDDVTDEVDARDFVDRDDGSGTLGTLDPQVIQAATQSKLDASVDQFRDVLVDTHARLDDLREYNQERIDSVGQSTSRNPTAYSTLAGHRGAPKGAERFSTVPRGVRHSSAPSRKRIYGSRFDRLVAERTEGDADE